VYVWIKGGFMKTARERAVDWLESRHKSNNSFTWDLSDLRHLEVLLMEQDKITRHACADAVVSAPKVKIGQDSTFIRVNVAEEACINVKAV